MSTRTSYHTIESEQSIIKHFSDEFITPPSSIEQLSSINSLQKQPPLQYFFNPFVSLSKRLFNNEKTISDKNNSSNYIVIDMKEFKDINLANNVSQM